MAEKDITGHVSFTPDQGVSPGELAGTIRVSPETVDALRSVVQGPTKVALQRSSTQATPDQALWAAIRNRTQAISFNRYNAFINAVLCEPSQGGSAYSVKDPQAIGLPPLADRRTEPGSRPSIYGVDAYNLLRLATEAFLILECGVVEVKDEGNGNRRVTLPDPVLFDAVEEAYRFGRPVTIDVVEADLTAYFSGTNHLPDLKRILDALLGLDSPRQQEKLPYCDAVLKNRFSCPALLELMWSYWHEQGMLVQTMNALAVRFQNRRSSADRDPLANLELDPMRPLNNLLWGYIQNTYDRLSVPRRAYEYDHHYGLTLYGKAVPQLRSADSRSKFLEAFHNLLYRTAVFFQEDADTTVVANGFPLLNALREVHLLPASRDAQPALTSEMMDYVELPAAPRQRSLRYRDNG
jgi:hypothetical protein